MVNSWWNTFGGAVWNLMQLKIFFYYLSAGVGFSFLGLIVFVLSQVESHDLRLDSSAALFSVNADKSICLRVELFFERNDDALDRELDIFNGRRGYLKIFSSTLYVIGNFTDVCIVKSSVYLVKDKEWRRPIRMYCENKRESRNCLPDFKLIRIMKR